MAGLYAAGEDTGGVHGANRLGGNGVANSTVFGGLAGDAMGITVRKDARLPDPDPAAIEKARERAFAPLGRRGGDLSAIREKLYAIMWDDVGILRDAAGLMRAHVALDQLAKEIDACGVPDPEKRYNLTWMDRLNLESLTLVSRAICAAALARENSSGAHYREDHPGNADPAQSRYTVARLRDGTLAIDWATVNFTRVRPGESLLHEAAE
jgi:fumarate reductase flavoprotein subunit